MSARLPEIIEPLSLCDRGEQLQGYIPLAGMGRLAGLLRHLDGGVEVDLQFDVDLQGVRLLRGHMKTEVALECQRCMETVVKPVELDVLLGFVDSEAAGKQLPGEYEPSVLEAPTVALRELVEDELILALPIVALHPLDECSGNARYEAADDQSPVIEEKVNPFAVLEGLKKDKPD